MPDEVIKPLPVDEASAETLKLLEESKRHISEAMGLPREFLKERSELTFGEWWFTLTGKRR